MLKGVKAEDALVNLVETRLKSGLSLLAFLGCIHYVSYRGGQRILGGDLKFLEQKKGGYENCLNISGGMLIFCKILSSFCNGFKR